MRKLGIDIDGVLANFCDAFAKVVTKQTGITFPRTSKEWPAVWNWDRAAGVTPEQEALAWKTVWADDNFWTNLAPMPEAQMTATQLNHLAKLGHEVYYLTHRAGDRAKYQTEKFLFGIGVDYPTVLLGGDKVPLIRHLKLDFFIDDRPDTILEVTRVAEEENLPVKGHIFVKDAPYNKGVNVGQRVNLVMDALKQEGLWG